jgi:hypothetical protein
MAVTRPSNLIRLAITGLVLCIVLIYSNANGWNSWQITRAHDSDRNGAITGIVVGSAGKPVASARVKASFTGSFDGIVPSAITDSSGHFVINHLPFGGYFVTAAKEQDGFPDQSNAFYSGWNSNPLPVELDSNHGEQTVTVHLGRKAGAIFGNVVDAETNEPVEPCAALRWKNDPAIAWSGTGLIKSAFRLLVPADTSFTVVVWQRGYEPWFYPKSRRRRLALGWGGKRSETSDTNASNK